MKTTNSTTYRSMLQYLNQATSRLQDLQTQAATGKKLNKVSDDPAAIGPLVRARSGLQSSDVTVENNQAIGDSLKSQDTLLGQVDSLLQRAIELTTEAGNGSYTASERSSMASEMHDIREEVLSLANSQQNGKYFYSGTATDQKPFSEDPATGAITYNGNSAQINMEIAPDDTMAVNFTGDAVFQGAGSGSGVDIFNVLGQLEQSLSSNDQAGASAQLDNLKSAQDQIGLYRSKTGVAATRVDRAVDYMNDVQVDLKEIVSRYEDADMVDTITKMTQQEQALQAAMSVTGKISKLSILDYL